MLAEFAVLKMRDSVRPPVIIDLEWPSATEEEAWIVFGELTLISRDGAVHDVDVITNRYFHDELASEYRNVEPAIQAEVETLASVVAHYLRGLPGISLAPMVKMRVSAGERVLYAVLHPSIPTLELLAEDLGQ